MNKQPDNLGKHLLIAMSNSPESLVLIRTLIGQVPGLIHKEVTLMHYIAPALWEQGHGGGSSAKDIQAIRDEEQQVWDDEQSHISLTHSYFDEAQFILEDAGVPKDHIHMKITHEGDSVADAILSELKGGHYSAVVIGAHHVRKLSRSLQNDLADVIQSHAGRNVHVWAIDFEHGARAGGKSAPKTPVYEVFKLGQSIWLDFISKDLLNSIEMWHMIQGDGLCGMTSNPTIFDKSIT
ncbi:MAG: universal stress protein, partial [Anaerolineae bacterium]|nr:universal stress protein [Anaerolineae bacterium]